jgi:hypothetical protein
VLTNFNRQILTVLPQYSAFKVLRPLLSTRDIIPWLRFDMQPLTQKKSKKANPWVQTSRLESFAGGSE